MTHKQSNCMMKKGGSHLGLLVLAVFSFHSTLAASYSSKINHDEISSSQNDNIFESLPKAPPLLMEDQDESGFRLPEITSPPSSSAADNTRTANTPPPIIWNNDDNGSDVSSPEQDRNNKNQENCTSTNFLNLPIDMQEMTKYLLGIIVALFLVDSIAGCCRKRRQGRQRREEARQVVVAERQRREFHHDDPTTTFTPPSPERYEQIVTRFYFQTVLADKTFSDRRSKGEKDSENPNDDACSTTTTPTTTDSNSSSGCSTAPSDKEEEKRGGDDWFHQSWRTMLSFHKQHERTCCICLEEYREGETICVPITFKCNHVFHEECMLTWLLQSKNNDCPLCRVDILKTSDDKDEVDSSTS